MNETNPIAALTDEHQYILKVVTALQVFSKRLEKADDVNIRMLKDAVEFLRDYADARHHAKEEAVLFPAMEEKGVPETGCPIGALRAEHVKGRRLVAELQEAIDQYRRRHEPSKNRLIAALDGICQLYPNHIWKEDEMVFPMVERLFSVDELNKLQADFARAEAELEQDADLYIEFADLVAETTSQSR